MAIVNRQYVGLTSALSRERAHEIVLLLLENRRSRPVILKMRENGINSDIAIVRQFIACNWDALEVLPDISDDNQLNFEYVDCGNKGANRRCPFSTPGDPKPYCIIKSLYNVPEHAYRTGYQHNG